MSTNNAQQSAAKKAPEAPPKAGTPSTSATNQSTTPPTVNPVKGLDGYLTEANIKGFNLSTLIKKLLQVGVPKVKPIDLAELRMLLIQVGQVYMEQRCALVECKAPIDICGDTHGQYNDVLRILNACGPATKNKYLFLGDYVDRGRHSLEVIMLLFALKLALPKKVYLLRGNHELKAINKNYGFYAEIKTRLRGEDGGAGDAEMYYTKFNEVFSYMPLAAIVSGKILCMHGGISPKLNSLDDIRNIPLPLETAKSHPLACDLLWADPDASTKTFQQNKTRAISHVFGEEQVDELCKKLGIDLVIRAHQVVEFGYAFFANKRLITVFSASRYQEEMQNYAAVVRVSRELEISFLQLKPEEYEKKRDDADKGGNNDNKEQVTGSGPGGS